MAKLKKKKRLKNPRLKWVVFTALSLILITLIYFSYRIFGPNTAPFSDHTYFYIHTGSTYRSVVRALQDQGIIKNIGSFEWIARQTKYPQHVHAGRYDIKAGMSNLEMVRLLRSGRQTPVRLVINKVRTQSDFAHLIGTNLEADSLTMMTLLGDEVYLRQYELDTSTALCAVIPNTYEFFWNTSAEAVYQRLEKEKTIFWNDDRIRKAESLGLDPKEVYILASIIEEETNKDSEKPTIASVYLNRLRSGMRLGADPTVKFAVGDFTLKRITSVQTAMASPYNTYRYAGLPPGPICTPSIKTIDAVLRTPKTDYFYFCAKADFSGYHVFASTYSNHLKNARAYQIALNKLNIH